MKPGPVTVRPCDTGGFVAGTGCGDYYATASGTTAAEARENVMEVWDEYLGSAPG